jgi:hypothetical protein
MFKKKAIEKPDDVVVEYNVKVYDYVGMLVGSYDKVSKSAFINGYWHFVSSDILRSYMVRQDVAARIEMIEVGISKTK